MLLPQVPADALLPELSHLKGAELHTAEQRDRRLISPTRRQRAPWEGLPDRAHAGSRTQAFWAEGVSSPGGADLAEPQPAPHPHVLRLRRATL